jgi:hypothetical protein
MSIIQRVDSGLFFWLLDGDVCWKCYSRAMGIMGYRKFGRGSRWDHHK